jgi:hypothetical protein
MKYDLDYWEIMLRQNSGTAEQISNIRWEFVKPANASTVLDFGSGVGWFRAFRPRGVTVFTYDIASYPQTSIPEDFVSCDLICLWDVLEHIPDFSVIDRFLVNTKFVAVSLPIVKQDTDFLGWKHFKPQEHLHYFTEEILDALFKKWLFSPIEKGSPECPPRKDILSVLYKRIV